MSDHNNLLYEFKWLSKINNMYNSQRNYAVCFIVEISLVTFFTEQYSLSSFQDDMLLHMKEFVNLTNGPLELKSFVFIAEYLMSLAAEHGPNHHDHSQPSDFNKNTSSSTEFNNTKIPFRMDLHINNDSSSSQEESYQADEAGDTERLHDKHILETNDTNKSDTAAAATSSASSATYPIILHTLLDDGRHVCW